MKQKNIISSLMLLACMAFAFTAKAQQTERSATINLPQQITGAGNQVYTYKTFQAPNKMYGYDIFQNGRIIFHQGASPVQPSEFVAATATQQQAEKAALLSIEKIKQNMPPVLSKQEIKNIITDKKS